MRALLELGDRYWALGLPAAAKSALLRALSAGDDVTPALRLTEIALAQGDAASARLYANEAAKRAPGPSTRILVGRAQLAAGEISASRMALSAALDSPKLQPWDRAQAHLELARAAAAQSDEQGAAAQAAAAFEAVVTATQKEPAELAVVEEVAVSVVAHGTPAEAKAPPGTGPGRPGGGAARPAGPRMRWSRS